MLTIGLTGGIGSGKSAAAHFFSELGIEIIDTDQIAREVVAPGSPAFKKIKTHFGNDILDSHQELNRSKLRDLVFKNPKEKLWLEQLLHPLIREVARKRMSKVKSPYCVVIIPLLAETQPNPLIDRILVIDAPKKLQIERTQRRDKMTQAQIKAIMETQASRKQRLSIADDVIYNDKTLDSLKQQVSNLHRYYLSIIS